MTKVQTEGADLIVDALEPETLDVSDRNGTLPVDEQPALELTAQPEPEEPPPVEEGPADAGTETPPEPVIVPVEMPEGYVLFGDETLKLKAACDSFGMNWSETIAQSMVLYKHQEELQQSLLDKLVKDLPEELRNTILSGLAVYHQIESARSSLGAVLQHGLLSDQAQPMVISVLVGLSETAGNFAGAAINQIARISGVGADTMNNRIYPEFNAIIQVKRDTFALMQRVNMDIMLKLRAASEAAVAEKRLSEADLIALPPGIKLH